MSTAPKPDSTGPPRKNRSNRRRVPPPRETCLVVPYLARYRPAIALGLLALVLTSIVGNIIPARHGVMTDILLAAPPFETNTRASACRRLAQPHIPSTPRTAVTL